MKLKEICTELGYDYDSKHHSQTLERIKKDYIIRENMLKQHDYIIERPLTEEEKINLQRVTDCKKLIKEMLFLCLSQEETNTIREDMKDYLVRLGIVNNNYNEFAGTKATPKRLEATKQLFNDNADPQSHIYELYDFREGSYTILSNLVYSVFKEMEKELLVSMTKVPKYVERNFYEKGQNDDGDIIIGEVFSTHEMTKDQIETYMNLAREEYKDLDYHPKDWVQVKYDDKCDINQSVAAKMGFFRIYNGYELILNRKSLQQLASELTEKELKTKLNREVADKLLRSKAKQLQRLSNQTRITGIEKLILIGD
jgi:hypothetical protein